MARQDVLPIDLAIRTEGLGKRYGSFEPPSSGSRLSWRARRGRGFEAAGLDPLDDDDDGAGDVETGEELDEPRDGDETWALCGVSIDVARGTGTAVLGPSGSGKSTLLRLLARITPPTVGRALVRGRVIPLVEVSTAFLQPDLTIRANIVALAQLFGVPRELARRQSENIVAFADVGASLGTPVKQLTSRLRRRLTIATALCLDADVILVEDFVARGDKAFARRALDRLVDLKHQGVTLLLATEDLDLARRHCDRAVRLDGGVVVDDGPIDDVIERYEAQRSETEALGVEAPSPPPVAIASAAAWSDEGARRDVAAGEDITVRTELDVADAGTVLRLRVALTMGGGSRLTAAQPTRFAVERRGRVVVTVVFPGGEINGSPVVGDVRCDIGSLDQRSTVALREAFELDVRGLEEAEIARVELGDIPGTAAPARRVTVELNDLDWRVELP